MLIAKGCLKIIGKVNKSGNLGKLQLQEMSPHGCHCMLCHLALQVSSSALDTFDSSLSGVTADRGLNVKSFMPPTYRPRTKGSRMKA